MKVIGKGHYVVKVDLCHVYGSVSAHLVNYRTLGLKWHFSGCKHYTYLSNTQWWDRLLGTFNGACDVIDSRPATDIYTDPFELSLDTIYKDGLFYSNLLVGFSNFDFIISATEVLCIIIALIYWDPSLHNKDIVIHFDNTTAVSIISKGTTKSFLVRSYIRTLLWCSATNNLYIKTLCILEHCNTLVDPPSHLNNAIHSFAILQFSRGGTVPASSVYLQSWTKYL